MGYDMAGIYSKHLIVFTCTYSTKFSDPEVYVQKKLYTATKSTSIWCMYICIYIFSCITHVHTPKSKYGYLAGFGAGVDVN